MGCLLTRISTDRRQHASMEAEMGWTLGGVGKAPKCWSLPKNWGKGMMPHWLTLSETNSQFAPASGPPAPKEISSSYFLLPIFTDKLLISGGHLFWGWHAKFCRFQTLILHWGTLRPWFVVNFQWTKKKSPEWTWKNDSYSLDRRSWVGWSSAYPKTIFWRNHQFCPASYLSTYLPI